MLNISLIPWKRGVSETGAEDFGPSTAVTRFRSEMDRLFERFFREPFWAGGEIAPERRGWSFGWAPSIDVTESEKEVLVRAEVPGVDLEDFDLQITGDVLTLSGEKKESTEEEEGDYYYAERRFGSFRRQIRLPTSVNPDQVNAEYRNGVLTIRMEKEHAAKPKRIPVSATA